MAENLTVYTGWRKWYPTDEEWSDFYMYKKTPFDLVENEYLIIYDKENCAQYYCFENGKLRQFRGGAIKVSKETIEQEDLQKQVAENKSKKQKFSKGKNQVITPRNCEQTCAFDLIKDTEKTVKLLLGTWGSGKDLIMASAALEALSKGEYEKIIWIRNPIKLKDTPDLGALPGDTIEKLLPYLGPFIDNVGEASVRTMLTKGSLAVEPLQALRGRNFKNSILICSEAENLTYDHLKLIIARVAEGSSIWINGDVRQRDGSVFEKSKGLEKFIECLKGEKLFGYVYMPKSERSETARLADKLDQFEIEVV